MYDRLLALFDFDALLLARIQFGFSLQFALFGALLIIPIILIYTAWSYWVFPSKVRHGGSYHS